MYASIDGARLGQVRYVGRCWCMVVGEVEVAGEVMVDRWEDRDVEEGLPVGWILWTSAPFGGVA